MNFYSFSPFSTQFQRDGRQVFTRCSGDDLAHVGASGEEDVIELLLEQRGRVLHAARHHPVASLQQTRVKNRRITSQTTQ